MKLHFTKMHGLGNDFIVLDGVNQSIELTKEQIKQYANRHTGIGFDQCLVVEKPRSADVDFFYRIFNADGSEVSQCGNGARCLAEFIAAQKLSDKKSIIVETNNSKITLQRNPDHTITVTMGVPSFSPASIPFNTQDSGPLYDLKLNDIQLHACMLNLGNPNAVIISDQIDNIPLNSLGKAINRHPDFPDGINLTFMKIFNRDQIKIRVYERGAGETLACGSGACAAVVAGRLQNVLDEIVQVTLNGGVLSIQWEGENHPVFMTGPAVSVFEGNIDL